MQHSTSTSNPTTPLSSPPPGFSRVTGGIKRRLVCAMGGMEKSGKTHQAFTAPGPIFYHSFDIGDEGVVDKFLGRGKEIWGAEYLYTKKDGQDTWATTWDTFARNFSQSVRSCKGGTIVVDTETEMYELIRLARFGKLDQVMPHRYGALNAELRELIRTAYQGDANVIFLRKMRPVYLNDKRTADYEPAGFGDLPYLVQANLQTWRDANQQWHLFIKDCRQNMTLAGVDLEGQMADFNVLLGMVFAS